ncbi:MAG: response regulator [Acidobacteriota bacterium]|nr:response regulator [Acidobacteriota bacterium]
MPHKLLLADDSVTIQRVIELTFADEDISVIAVGDGRKAIERVQSDRPDIVLADVGMPERDGYEVAAFVKGTPSLAHIPVLLLTGAFEPIDEGRAQAAGCDGVLIKPFEPQMVISRVKDLIAGRRPVQKMPPPQPLPLPSTDTMRTSAPASNAAGGASVDEYFDRLDAAFASLDSQPTRTESVEARREATSLGSPNTGLGHELANWHPELEVPQSEADAAVSTHTGEPMAPEMSLTAPAQRQAAPAPPASTAAPAPLPTLAEAFAALLAAERGSPVAAAPPAPAAATEDLVEQVTRRVIERIGEATVRDVVIEVTERLVAEEIARIKAAAR